MKSFNTEHEGVEIALIAEVAGIIDTLSDDARVTQYQMTEITSLKEVTRHLSISLPNNEVLSLSLRTKLRDIS